MLLLAPCLPAHAQSAVHGPAATPPAGNAADFSGIWLAKGALDRTLEGTLNIPPPPYKPDWMKIWDEKRAMADRGERVETEAHACLPPGMPHFNNFIYPTEILMTPGQITMLAEYYMQTRRIYMDGRPHPKPDDLEPTFEGHSIGHWEGKTLVIDTVGVRTDTFLRRPGGHSDKMHIVEHVRALGPNELEWITSVEDPVALTKPYVVKRLIDREPADVGIRDYACSESTEKDPYVPSSAPAAALDPAPETK